MHHRAPQDRIGLGVDLLRVDHAFHEPRRRAVGEALELRGGEDLLRRERRDDRISTERGRAIERRPRAIEASRPVVRSGQRVRALLVVCGEPDERAEPLARARRRLERPRERREGSASRRALHVRRVEQRPDVLPERARLARHALVSRRLAHEDEPPCRTRARRVEEIAVTGDSVGTLEAAAELGTELVAREVARAGRVAGTSLPRARARTRPRTSASSPARGRGRRRGPSPGSRARPAFARALRARPPGRSRRLRPRPQTARRAFARLHGTRARRSGRRRSSAATRAPMRCAPSRRVTAGPRQPGCRLPETRRAAGTGAPRSRSLSSSTRAGSATARPRKRPSTKSTERRSRPENGERRNANRSRRPPPSHS